MAEISSHQDPCRGGGPLPADRPDEGGGDQRHHRRPDQRRVGRIVPRGEAGQDLVDRPQHRADQRQQHRPVDGAQAGLDDQQDAAKAHGDGQPARQSRLLAQEQHAERDDHQRRGRRKSMRVGERQVAEGEHEDGAFDQQDQRTSELQPRPFRSQRFYQPLAAHDDPAEQEDQRAADPHDLDDRIVGHQEFADRIHAGVAQHRQQDEKGAQRVVGSRSSGARRHSAAARRAGGRKAGITRSANSFRLFIVFSRP